MPLILPSTPRSPSKFLSFCCSFCSNIAIVFEVSRVVSSRYSRRSFSECSTSYDRQRKRDLLVCTRVRGVRVSRLVGLDIGNYALMSCCVSWVSRPVAKAYAIVVLTILGSGFHVCGSDSALPPTAVEIHPVLFPIRCNSCLLWLSHWEHRNMKCLTVSLATPQGHIFDSAAPIRCRYPSRRAIPVLSWARMLASPRLSLSYSLLAWLPGRAASISLENLPIPSGSFLFCLCLLCLT